MVFSKKKRRRSEPQFKLGRDGRTQGQATASASRAWDENVPDGAIIDGQIMELNAVSDVIQRVCVNHNMKADRVVTGVSGHSVIIKNIALPAMSDEELEESIDWHAEEHVPYDLADVSLDYQVTGRTSDSTHVLIAACKRDRIENVRQAIQLAGKEAAVIDVDTFALQNCYEVNYQPDESQVVTLLNIGLYHERQHR